MHGSGDVLSTAVPFSPARCKKSERLACPIAGVSELQCPPLPIRSGAPFSRLLKGHTFADVIDALECGEYLLVVRDDDNGRMEL